jgi:hypothetical protein
VEGDVDLSFYGVPTMLYVVFPFSFFGGEDVFSTPSFLYFMTSFWLYFNESGFTPSLKNAL